MSAVTVSRPGGGRFRRIAAMTFVVAIAAYLVFGAVLALSGAGRAGRCNDPACGQTVKYTGNVLSPGGWTPPPSARPGWDWVPNGAAMPRADLAPLWVRVLYELPGLDRYAAQWMWTHGAFEVQPPLPPAP